MARSLHYLFAQVVELISHDVFEGKLDAREGEPAAANRWPPS